MIDAEPVVLAFLRAEFEPGARVLTDTPADFTVQGNLPCIKVQGLGGRRRLTLGAPVVDVECYAATRDGARDLAGQVNDALQYRLHGEYAGAVVTKVRPSLPSFRPYDNPNVRRFGSNVQLWLHDLAPV